MDEQMTTAWHLEYFVAANDMTKGAHLAEIKSSGRTDIIIKIEIQGDIMIHEARKLVHNMVAGLVSLSDL